jgi:hypothetical protein
VVISGVLFGGVPGRILSAWHAGQLALVLSASIFWPITEKSPRI